MDNKYRLQDEDCSAGTYSDDDNSCKACVDGSTWQNEIKQNTCKLCATCGDGQQVSSACTTTTNTVCEDCSAGTYESDGTCTVCTSGTYQDLTGQTSCKQCVVNNAASVASDGSFDETSDCYAQACNPGYELNGRVCDSCPIGTFSDGTECTTCFRRYFQ